MTPLIKIDKFYWINTDQITSVYYHEGTELEIKLSDKQYYVFCDEDATEKFNLLKEYGVVSE